MEIYFKYIHQERRLGWEKMSLLLNLETNKNNRANPEKQGGRK